MKLSPVTATDDQLDDFQFFKDGLQDSIDRLNEEAGKCGLSLDLTVQSADTLETLCETLLDRGESREDVASLGAGLLGEIFRNEIGGGWELCLKDKKYLYLGLPVVSGYATCDIEFCPIEVLRNFCYEPRRGLLTGAIESHREFKA